MLEHNKTQKTSISGFPYPPQESESSLENWKINLEHWKTEIDFQRKNIDSEKLEIERAKLEIEHSKLVLEKEKINNEFTHISTKAVFEFSKYAINTALLINGGAAIALLTHLVGTRSQEIANKISIFQLQTPIKTLCAGIVFAAITAAFTYLAQSFFTDRKNSVGFAFQLVAVLSWSLSIGAFCTAIWRFAEIISKPF